MPAGWYPDPTSRHQRRYWDGTRWTDQVSSSGRQGVDPFAATPSASGTMGNISSPPVERYPSRPRTIRTQPTDGLFTEPVLVVHQKARPFRSTVGYRISNQHGHPIGVVTEVDRNLRTRMDDAQRGRTDHDRSYRLQVTDITGNVVLTLARPEYSPAGWRAVLVSGSDGTPVGQIVQETVGLRGSMTNAAHRTLDNVAEIAGLGVGFVVGRSVGQAVGQSAGKTLGKAAGWMAGKTAAGAARTATHVTGVSSLASFAASWLDLTAGHARFGLEADVHRLGSIHTENVDEWDFRIEDPEGTEIARVTKTWAGWIKELFTNVDHYVVQIHQPLDRPLRSLVIAAALAIDLSLKQREPA